MIAATKREERGGGIKNRNQEKWKPSEVLPGSFSQEKKGLPCEWKDCLSVRQN